MQEDKITCLRLLRMVLGLTDKRMARKLHMPVAEYRKQEKQSSIEETLHLLENLPEDERQGAKEIVIKILSEENAKQ